MALSSCVWSLWADVSPRCSTECKVCRKKPTLLGLVTDKWKGGLKKYALKTRYDANCWFLRIAGFFFLLLFGCSTDVRTARNEADDKVLASWQIPDTDVLAPSRVGSLDAKPGEELGGRLCTESSCAASQRDCTEAPAPLTLTGILKFSASASWASSNGCAIKSPWNRITVVCQPNVPYTVTVETPRSSSFSLLQKMQLSQCCSAV